MSTLVCIWQWIIDSAAGISAVASLVVAFGAIFIAFMQSKNNEKAQLERIKADKINMISRDIGDALRIARSWELDISAQHSPFEFDLQTYSSIYKIKSYLNKEDERQSALIEALSDFSRARGVNVKVSVDEVIKASQEYMSKIRSAKSVSELL